MKAPSTISRLIAVSAVLLVATAAVALRGDALSSQPSQRSAAQLGSPTNSSASANTPVKVKAGRAATKRVSMTPLGPPPASARAKRRNVADRELQKSPRLPAKPHEEEEEVHTGEARNPTSTKLLTYHGGAVQTSPRIYLVLWGPTWFTGGDPNGVASRLHYFYQGVGGSAWANALKQFSSNYGSFTNPTGQYRGWSQDTTPAPATPTKDDVARAAQRAAQRMNDYNYNAQYIIATPWGVVDQFSTAKGFCGWHDYTTIGSSWVTYTSLPYTPYMDTIGRGCGRGQVNGANGLLDGVTIMAGHEYAESVNDPSLHSWFDQDGDENADKCSWVNLANRTLANGYAFPMQPYWSNLWRNQYGYGCYFS